ncbi:C-C motif chemokine 28 [Lissotriton helveticus]
MHRFGANATIVVSRQRQATARTMDPKALTALAGLVLACCWFQPSEAFSPNGISCCTEVGDHLSMKALRRVLSCEIQRADGVCDIAAVVLHTKYKILCANPNNKNVKRWMKKKCRDDKINNHSTSKNGKKRRKNGRKVKRVGKKRRDCCRQ